MSFGLVRIYLFCTFLRYIPNLKLSSSHVPHTIWKNLKPSLFPLANIKCECFINSETNMGLSLSL